MKNTFLVFVALLFSMIAHGQDNKGILDQLTGKLENYKQDFPMEKVYIQTDKGIYFPGEIIWFSGWVVECSESLPSQNYKEIKINLYDESGHFVSGDKFPVEEGYIRGDLLLSGELPLGRYYLAAFTPLQSNPEDVFLKPVIIDRYYESDAIVTFTEPDKIYTAASVAEIEMKVTDFNGNPVNKFLLNYELRHGKQKLEAGKVRSSGGIAVIRATMPVKTGDLPLELLVSHPKNLWSKKMAIKTSSDEIQVKFYVEGGNLVGTVPQKTGFYTTAWNTVPVHIEADITDAEGRVLTNTKTFMPGFGIFSWKGTPGEKHKLIITSSYGKGQVFELPQTGDVDLAMTVSEIDDEFITADLLVGGTDTQNILVTITKGTLLLWSATREITETTRMKIPVAGLSPGVIRLSAFDNSGRMLTSRLVYIADQNKLGIELTSEFTDKEHVKITVRTVDENKQPIAARVILSVADEMRKYGSDGNLNTYLTLKGDLENHVTDTGYPSGENALPADFIDNLMICNELKSISWENILDAESDRLPETKFNSMVFSGRVTDRKGSPVPGAKISIMNSRNIQMYSATADEHGNFRFSSQHPFDISNFNTSATGADGKGNYQVIMDPTFSEKVGLNVEKTAYRYIFLEAPRRNIAGYLASNPDLLSEQPSLKPVATGSGTQRSDSYKALLQTATSLLDVIRSMKPYNLMNGQIVFYGMINSFQAQSGALIVIDGQQMGTQADVLSSISPYDVDKINISLDAADILKYTGLNNVGVIEITTKKGEFASSPGVRKPTELLYGDGYRIPRNFLTTDALQAKSGKDIRTTLYWDPNLNTGSAGTSAFSIPVSDISSDFVIRAEGITHEGQTGSGEITFRIK